MACPACGSTRSVLAIINGSFREALYWNPLGFLLLGFLLIAPIWIVTDFVTGKKDFFKKYQGIETWFSKGYVILVFGGLILLNWIWNIVKGL